MKYDAMNFDVNLARILKLLAFFLSAAILSACNTVPKNLRSAPELSPLVSDVQGAPTFHLKKVVRWGGSIVAVKHEGGQTTVQIVSRPLSRNSRPMGIDQTHGRFLAVFEGFLEPEIYKEKRLLTILGTIESVDSKKIGDMDYVFPIVRVQEHHLWQKENQAVYPQYRRGDPWPLWHSPYPYFYYDDFYIPLWHRPKPSRQH